MTTTLADLEQALIDPDVPPEEFVSRFGNVNWRQIAVPLLTQLVQRHRNQRDTIHAHNEARLGGQTQTIADLRQHNENQMNQISTLQTQVNLAKEAHERDINTIGARFSKEAIGRGWCSEWDDIREELDENLTFPLQHRSRTGQVQLTYTVTVIADLENIADTDEDLADLAFNQMDERGFFAGESTEVNINEGDDGRIRYRLGDWAMANRTVLS